jgi:CRP-like cAMP-binding protein
LSLLPLLSVSIYWPDCLYYLSCLSLLLIALLVSIFCSVYQVNEISEGGYFGELGLMTHQPRATSIVAKGEVKVACKYGVKGIASGD